jgi:hypothetical protein
MDKSEDSDEGLGIAHALGNSDMSAEATATAIVPPFPTSIVKVPCLAMPKRFVGREIERVPQGGLI